jgi:hypothetical protein
LVRAEEGFMSSSEPPIEAPIEPPERRIEPRPVLPSAIEAGLVAGLVVAGLFLVRDLLAGTPLQTPSALGTLLLEGSDAARIVVWAPAAAVVFHTLHFMLWAFVGGITVVLVHRVDRTPAGWYWPWVAAGVVFLCCIAFDAWAANSGLPRLHLWLGSVAGFGALALFIGWRHPHAMARVRGISAD